MAIVSLNTIKSWFRIAKKPTQGQFWDTFDSFYHKDEKLPIEAVNNLSNLINNKLDTDQFDGHVNNKDNPHQVTAEQVGLGDIDERLDAKLDKDDERIHDHHNLSALAEIGEDNEGAPTWSGEPWPGNTIDGQHFSWANTSNVPTYIWGTNTNGQSFLAELSKLSVKNADTISNVPLSGLMQQPIKIPASTSLNSYTTPGMYYCPSNVDADTISNKPYNGTAFSLLVEKHAGVKQTFTLYLANNISTWVRNYYDTWGTWYKTVAGDGSAVNADTVDGKHAADFLPRVVHYDSGGITDPNTTEHPRLLARHNNCPSNRDNDDFWYIDTFFYHSLNTSKIQVAYSYARATPVVYVRTLCNSVWTAWRNIADGGNADTVDGKHANQFVENPSYLSRSITLGADSTFVYPKINGTDASVYSAHHADTVGGKAVEDLSNYHGFLPATEEALYPYWSTLKTGIWNGQPGRLPNPPATFGLVFVMNNGMSDVTALWCQQPSGKMWRLASTPSATTGWVNIADGGNADTVDGKHAKDFVWNTSTKANILQQHWDSSKGAIIHKVDNADDVPVSKAGALVGIDSAGSIRPPVEYGGLGEVVEFVQAATVGLSKQYPWIAAATRVTLTTNSPVSFSKSGAFQTARIVSTPDQPFVFTRMHGSTAVWGPWLRSNDGGAAAQLQTPRSIWGQSFNGTGNVRGVLSDVDKVILNENGAVSIGNRTSYGASSIELYGGTPFIDFHFNNSTADYTSRIIEAEAGVLYMYSALNVSGNVSGLGFYQSSDERLKDIKADFNPKLEDILELPLFYYTLKDNPDKLEIGTSAQKVMSKFPELVTQNAEGYYSVAYDKLAVLALKGMSLVNEELSFANDSISLLNDKLAVLALKGKSLMKEELLIANDSISQLTDKLSKLEERLAKIENYKE